MALSFYDIHLNMNFLACTWGELCFTTFKLNEHYHKSIEERRPENSKKHLLYLIILFQSYLLTLKYDPIVIELFNHCKQRFQKLQNIH